MLADPRFEEVLASQSKMSTCLEAAFKFTELEAVGQDVCDLEIENKRLKQALEEQAGGAQTWNGFIEASKCSCEARFSIQHGVSEPHWLISSPENNAWFSMFSCRCLKADLELQHADDLAALLQQLGIAPKELGKFIQLPVSQETKTQTEAPAEELGRIETAVYVEFTK